MKYAVIVARSLLGLVFFAFGMMFFLQLVPQPPMDPDAPATRFAMALGGSGYMHAIKVFEVVGGALLLSGFYVPLGLVLLAPVILNIAFFHVFLDKTGYGMTAALIALEIFLLYAYRRSFAPLLVAKPEIAGVNAPSAAAAKP
jgi:uncharacterized membrane protein YphA (DoxX/SURF4 family)